MHRLEARTKLLELLRGLLDGTAEAAQYYERGIALAMEAARAEGAEVTDEMTEEVRVTLMAASIAITAAHIAHGTEGTDEEGMPPAMILAMWSGMLLQSEVEDAMQEQIKQMLGMGDN